MAMFQMVGVFAELERAVIRERVLAGLAWLDREVGSMTEFKQIVGRGTRLHEDTKQVYFTLIDLRGASSHFADPDFDGELIQMTFGLRGRTPPGSLEAPLSDHALLI